MSVDEVLGEEKEKIKEKVKEQFGGLITEEEADSLASKIASKLSEEGFGEEDVTTSIERMLSAVMTLTVGVEMIRMVQKIMSATYSTEITGSLIMVPMDIQGSTVMMPVDIQAQVADINVNITNSTINVNVTNSTLNVTISGTVDVNVTNATINTTITNSVINVLAPSGFMVSTGYTVPVSSVYTGQTINAGSELEILSVTGRGRINALGFFIYAADATQDVNIVAIRVYIDGAKKLDMTTNAIDALNGELIKWMSAATSTWYRPSTINPVGGINQSLTTSSSTQTWQKRGGFLNLPMEFTSSLSVRVYNPNTYAVYADIVVIYGTYV